MVRRPADEPEVKRAVATVTPETSAAPVPPLVASELSPVASPTSDPAPSPTALASAGRSAPAAADAVMFNLTSDLPDTKVVFDGAAVGRTPIATLKRSAGKHTVTFSSDDLGENLSTSVDAKAGESLKIRAQFKKPDPSIAVRR
jgi:hypothetical protein